ncbi:uncharacterized protein LOC112053802 [Bicyclus anynana]|uniref:unspecific monooxygenase n=1 Tax=Bicyclus anynana TaxID=110368 RepID=A0ABM3LMX7_BICAN|nr:uncharacterized protein LOC112053802 [Bicyclus anynana]
MIIFIWIGVLIAVLVLYIRKSHSRFSDYGVKHPRAYPFFGNMARIVFRIDNFSDDLDRYYDDYREERFVGKYEFLRPLLIVKDLELVKKIGIKDFEYFLDHRSFTNADVEPLFSRNILSLKGQEWKDMRSTLSPAFTSSKIKLMVPFMQEAGEQMIRSLKKKFQDSPTGSLDIDCKDLTSRYANDVIASCAFGLKVDSHTDQNNKFFEMGKNASTFKLKQMMLFFAVSICPAIANKLKLTLFSNETKDFFIDLVSSTMKDREVRNIIRPDMIHLLMEAKKGKLSHEEDKNISDNNNSGRDAGFATVEESTVGKKNIDRVWSDIDLYAQATLFFIAGFETISTGMSFALHELALHPDIQDKLYKEIKENDIKYGGKLNYSAIQNMTYLDMVVSEVLRIWPPGLALDRVCVKDYNLGKPNDKATKDYIIRKGEALSIPAWCFHHDPEYFPDPERFDPDRFSDENKHLINPLAYMPFGVGPRNCIGSRFALCELKVLLYQILLHIEVSPSPKTQLPSKLSAESFNLRLQGGHWLTFKSRDLNVSDTFLQKMIIIVWISVLIVVLMIYYRKSYSRFSDYGVKNPRAYSLFGNMTRMVFRLDNFCKDLDHYYKDYPGERFVGKYEFLKPCIFVKELELVKKITIKDFEYFIDHRNFTNGEVEPLFSRNVTSLKGQEWKDMRSTLSPAFTSSKIKLMVPFMEEAGDQMIRSLKKMLNDSPTGSLDIDCKDLTSRYANDVIASCAFGLKVDSHTDANNEFYEMARNASTFKLKQMILFFAVAIWPSLAKKLKLTLFTNETRDFFINLVSSTMKDREVRNIIRPDMIHLLMEAKKGKLSYEEDKNTADNNSGRDAGFATVEESTVGKKKIDRVWSDIDLIAQATIFFIAGFETSSTGMSFALLELALYPDIQDRLYKEIKENHEKNGGKLSYSAIQNMTYLDMVVSEVLRKWPPALILDRMCVKDYNLGKPNDNATKDYIIHKEEVVSIPVWCFHHDPEYFPNPERFDPDRFSDENKHLINPLAYMPFGVGPRNCIGSRFALCEMKVLLYQILLHMVVSPSPKIQLPIQISAESFNLRPEGGHWLTFKSRDKMIFLIWTVVLIAALVLHFKKTYSKFSDVGVKNPKVYPFFGNMFRVVCRLDDFTSDLYKYYFDYPQERFVGKYEFMRPVVLVRDLDLAKKIAIKDFEHFLDHRSFTNEKAEPLFSRNLFSLRGQEWKDMRSTLSPAFTSSKIKLMVPFMEEVGKQMIHTMKKKIKDSTTDSVDIDCKDMTSRYSGDVIASCAFGLKVDSQSEESSHFYEHGKNASAFRLRQMIMFFIMSACPGIAKKLNLTIFSDKTRDFFVDLVSKTMKDRETRNIIRPDMIHLLMEAKKGQLSYDDNNSSENGDIGRDAGFATVDESTIGKKKTDRVWSDMDLYAQATLFLIAGFETVSTAMSFALHELALHPDIQERLYEEIKQNDVKNGGKLNYAAIQNMTYMDMVVSEVLRMWPPGVALDRICVKDYNLGKPNDKATKDYTIRKGEAIWIPTWCFHRDPKYFPDPEKFDPERFSDANKHLINSTAYMPFGLGPRNCIGSRFALCEVKVLLYQILLHIEVSPSVKTQLPSRLSTESFNPRLAGGHWLTFKLRN